MLDNDILAQCLRSTANSDEFEVKPTKFTEDLEKVKLPKPSKIKMEGEDDEFEDEMYSQDDIDDESDGEDIAVIDTELTDDTEGDAKPQDYVGQYIVICPVCLNPIFSDKPNGEVYCKVCDMEVEIESANGKVVSPDAEVVEPTDGDDGDDTDADDIATDAVDDMTDEGNAESGEAGTDADTSDKDESLNESVSISVCPEGSVTVSDDKADAVVTVAPTSDVTEAPTVVDEPIASDTTVYAPVVPDDVPVPPDEDELVDVDDYDTESFDSQVNSMLSEVYEDKDITYESTNVIRKGKGLVIEGVIKSNGSRRSKKVTFVCNESKSKSNVLKLEGLVGLSGKVMTECKYDANSKSLKTESLKYKFLAKTENKARIIRSK